MGKCLSKTMFVMLLFAVAVMIFVTTWFYKTNIMLKSEINSLKHEKVKMLEEHADCLKHKEVSLKKELIQKYVDSMIILRNKIDKGYVPVKQDLDNFFDRSEFILANLQVFEPSKEEITQHLVFISSMKGVLEVFSAKETDKVK